MSTTPLATIFHGDVTLETGNDVTQFGWGDINISRRCVINGNENSTCNTDGSLIVAGGAGITKTLNVHENLNVLYGITNLAETHIDTSNGPFTVTGGNTAIIQVGDTAQFISTGGNVNVNSLTGILDLRSGINSADAVNIIADSNNGGISLLSGSVGGEIRIVSGSGGITETTSNGNISITAINGNGSFVVNSAANNQNLSINLNGSTDSQLKIESAGTNLSNTALVINTSNANGNIRISNANGLGSGSMSQLVGSGGYNLVTNTSGSISMISQAASSEYIVKSSNNDQHLTIGLINQTDSALILKSSGTNVTNTALQILTTSLTGNISINSSTDSGYKLDVTGNISSGNANLGNLATANFFSGAGNNLSNIQGANVTGTVSAATTAGTVTTAAQPNITSVGTLTSLAVTGNISGANLTGTHYGAATGLTSIPGGNVTGTVANATFATSAGSATTAGTVTTNAQPNITSVGTLSSLNVSGTTTSGLFTGNGSGLTNITISTLIGVSLFSIYCLFRI